MHESRELRRVLRAGLVVRATLIAAIVLLTAGCGDQSGDEQTPRSADPSSSATPPSEEPAYEWVDDITPADTYAVAFVRGMTADRALEALGGVRRMVGRLDAGQALDLSGDLADPTTYETPPIVQVDEVEGGVIIYAPYGWRPVDRLRALSEDDVAAAFSTTVELDTTIDVARNGRLVREFDPFSYDTQERGGALPQERGMGFTDEDGFSPAWRFLDRMTTLHVGRDEFLDTPHPTYVLKGRD